MTTASEFALSPPVTVYEAGRTDGFQDQSSPMPSHVKLELIHRLGAARLPSDRNQELCAPAVAAPARLEVGPAVNDDAASAAAPVANPGVLPARSRRA